jgi:hypothetical protein
VKTIYTVIFGNYDSLKEPTIITPGWEYICFTDQNLKSNIWQIKKIDKVFTNQITARDCKISFYKNVSSKYSIYIDGSFQINCDLNKWWGEKFVAPITCITHPFRDCIYDEVEICLKQNRGDKNKLIEQMSYYKESGFPKNFGLIQSGILMREKCSEVIELCDLWFGQILKFSTRDQISFSYINWKYKPKINLITNWKYGRDNQFIFYKHLKNANSYNNC